jgi:ABC-type polysaccharide/polyol phosphate transport system ATPase subunit
MSDLAISVCNVKKKYRLFNSSMERLKEALHPFRKHYHREFWALNGVSIDIPKGQTIGILGRNGSGKSTLLQIIAGILQPTSGSLVVQGRVSALLELGAGFNPEFTGRDNVMLNGAITGVSREEMVARMPRIEAFADIGEFFDQPVKTYSSGMFVRVAFAAAINVDPDILIVDEALAVGDGKFQHKCFSKFAEFKAAGKTIIIVSHDPNLVANCCDRAILLDAGHVLVDDEPNKTVDKYFDILFGSERVGELSQETTGSTVFDRTMPVQLETQLSTDHYVNRRFCCEQRRSYNSNETRIGDRSAEIVDYYIETNGEMDVNVVKPGDLVTLHFVVRFHQSMLAPIVGFSIKSITGLQLYGTNTFMLNFRHRSAKVGEMRTFCFRFQASLSRGDYFVDLGIATNDGTSGGRVVELRRSIAQFIVSAEGLPSFDGLFDLAPTFSELPAVPLSPI